MRKIALFDTPFEVHGNWNVLPLERVRHSGVDHATGYFEAEFTTQNGQPVTFIAVVGILAEGGVGTPAEVIPAEATQIDIRFNVGDSYELTGKGEAVQILNGITKLTLQVYDDVRRFLPHIVICMTFTAEDIVSRNKLYARFANGIANARGGQVIPHGWKGLHAVLFSPRTL